MTRIRVGAVVLGTITIAVVVAIPPYMVVDRAAPATRHSGLGHHPAWNPPTPAEAEEVLSEQFGPPPGDPASLLAIRRNNVLFTIEIVLVVLAATAVWLAAGRRRS